MFRSPSALAAFAAISLALTACSGAGKSSDTAPVMAKVYGEAITKADIKAAAPSADTPEAEQAVLSDLINRKLLAHAAADTKSASSDADMARAAELAAANAQGRAILDKQSAPTPQDVEAFIARHPESFGQRRFLVVDQIELRRADGGPAPTAPPTAGALSLDGLQAQLDASNIPYQRTLAVVDTASASPATVSGLLAAPQGTLFSIQAPGAKVVGRVMEVRDAPFGGPLARQVAANLLKAENARASLKKSIDALRLKAGKQIEYSEGYGPPS